MGVQDLLHTVSHCLVHVEASLPEWGTVQGRVGLDGYNLMHWLIHRVWRNAKSGPETHPRALFDEFLAIATDLKDRGATKVIFVFDGIRPNIKVANTEERRHPLLEAERWAATLIQAFNELNDAKIQTRTSMMETDSELAVLCARNQIDVIVSRDSDMVVHCLARGAEHARIWHNFVWPGCARDELVARDILPIFDDSVGRLIRHACIVGCDYFGGIKGIGHVGALQLSSADLERALAPFQLEVEEVFRQFESQPTFANEDEFPPGLQARWEDEIRDAAPFALIPPVMPPPPKGFYAVGAPQHPRGPKVKYRVVQDVALAQEQAGTSSKERDLAEQEQEGDGVASTDEAEACAKRTREILTKLQ